MKKTFFYATAAAVTLAFAFTSCEKYEVSEPLQLSSLPTVTIEGDMYAQLDKTNSNLENAPAGLTVTVSIPLSDFNPNSDSDGNHIIKTKTDANGKFSIAIPVVSSGVDATISFESFTASVLEELGQTGVYEKTTLFELGNKSVSGLGAGNSTKLIDLGSLVYVASSTDPNAGSFTPNTSITYAGTLSYPVKRKAGVLQSDTLLYAPIPAGTIVVVKITSKNAFGNQEFKQTSTITTTAGGKYEVQVPLVLNGTATLSMTSTEILEFEDVILDKRSLNVNELNAFDNLHFVNYSNEDYKYVKGTFVQEVE